ncbi:MAG: hypothetical protein ACW986_01515 [Promethearchaeota archaeon]|jgi:hypothetical protein
MSKKSILLGLTIFMTLFLSFTAIKVNANPPSNMSLSYNSSTDQLNATITHLTGGTPGHYIESVIIRVNGTIVHAETYGSQPSPTTFTYQYLNIVANIGATIQVRANCSFTGDVITRTINLTGDNGTSPADSIPGYLGIWIGFAVCIGILTPLIYKKIKKGNSSWD